MNRRGLPWPIHRDKLDLQVPFDLGLSLLCGQAFRWQPMDGGGYRGVMEGTVVEIWQRTDRTLRWESGPRPLTGDQVTSYFRLDDDLETVRRAIGDPAVNNAFATSPGLRLLRQDPWETLISFVISQVSNVPRISRTVDSLAMNYGDHLGTVSRPPSRGPSSWPRPTRTP